MKKYTILLAVVAVLLPAIAEAQQWVNGYSRKNGTYVQGHYRSKPDSNPYNNYSTRGNTNPYTGSRGYKNPQPTVGYGILNNSRINTPYSRRR